MAIRRVWQPSPSHGDTRTQTRLICIHTTEGARSAPSLAAFCANPANEVSYHVGADDDRSRVIEMVNRDLRTWSAFTANNLGVHGCLCAFSAWTRTEWLTHDGMLRALADWVLEEAARYQIPLVRLTPQQIRGGARGVCGHGDYTLAMQIPPRLDGNTHTDPGPNFPWDVFMRYAGAGGATSPPAPAPPPPQPPTILEEDHMVLVHGGETVAVALQGKHGVRVACAGPDNNPGLVTAAGTQFPIGNNNPARYVPAPTKTQWHITVTCRNPAAYKFPLTVWPADPGDPAQA